MRGTSLLSILDLQLSPPSSCREDDQKKMAAPAVSNTFVGLKQTVCWDIRRHYPEKGRIPVPEWMDFLQKDAGFDLKNVSDALQHSITGNLLIQVPSEDLYKKILRKAEDGVLWSRYGVRVYGWSAGEETTKVHLHNILQESDLEAAVREMGRHGTIINREVHYYKQAPTIRNGIVTLTMRLSPGVEMPGFIYEEGAGNTIQVFSDKHERACWRCLGKGHIAAFCRKPVTTQETASKTKTWARIVAGPTPAAPLPTDMQEILKVMEEIEENSTSTLSVEELKTPAEKTKDPGTEKPRVTPYKLDTALSVTRDHSGQRGIKRHGVQEIPDKIREKRERIKNKIK